MHNTAQKEHQSIARLVRAFVSPSTRPEELSAVIRALGASVRVPNDIISCMTIPDDHFLKSQAYAVRDAFEAVTNGMTNPAALAELDALPADSVLAPWKDLVLAIKAFYEGDRSGRDERTAAIPPDSFPARIGILWKELDARESGFPPQASGSGLADAVYPPSEGLGLLAEEIRESLDEGMEDYFLSAAARLLRELSSLSPGAASRAALGILAEVDARGASPDAFLRLLRQHFGESEGLRLTALYLSESRPGLSLLFWLKAACTELSSRPNRSEMAAWLLSMGPTAERARKGEGLAELLPAMLPLVDRLAGLGQGFDPPLRAAAGEDALARLEALRASCLPDGGRQGKARGARQAEAPLREPAPKGTRPRGRQRSQLELFLEHGP